MNEHDVVIGAEHETRPRDPLRAKFVDLEVVGETKTAGQG